MGKSPGITTVQRRTLDQLKLLPELTGFYLAGGTAISVQLGHRQSLSSLNDGAVIVGRRLVVASIWCLRRHRSLSLSVASSSDIRTTRICNRSVIGLGRHEIVGSFKASVTSQWAVGAVLPPPLRLA